MGWIFSPVKCIKLKHECWSANRVVINEVSKILKYQCNINGFSFIFHDWRKTVANVSFNCSLFYKDMLDLIKQGNVKLAKLITLAITPQYNHINLSLTKSNTYSEKCLNYYFFPLKLAWSCLYQCKVAINVKHVSVHVVPFMLVVIVNLSNH